MWIVSARRARRSVPLVPALRPLVTKPWAPRRPEPNFGGVKTHRAFCSKWPRVLLSTAVLASACAPRGTVVRLHAPAPSLAGNRLGTPTEQPIAVYLPPGYASSQVRYPVVYVLPGFTTPVEELFDGTYRGFRLERTADALVRRGLTRELILVVVNGVNELGGSFYANSPVTGGWEDFVARDVPAYVDARFRTRPSPDSRGLAGSSMGGFGALNIGLRHPDVFGAVYSLSPGLFDRNGLADQGMWSDPERVRLQLERRESLALLPPAEGRTQLLAMASRAWSSGRDERRWAFAVAYGAALVPNPGAPPPWSDSPVDREGHVDAAVFQRYAAPLGDWSGRIEAYRKGPRHLRGLVLDYAVGDGYTWIPRGTRHVSALLDAAGVPHRLLWHVGGHEDRLPERFRDHILPFFSDTLR